MRLRFWKWVHDRLEDAWHWVYYHKVQPRVPIGPPNVVGWRVTYLTKEGFETAPSPIQYFPSTDTPSVPEGDMAHGEAKTHPLKP